MNPTVVFGVIALLVLVGFYFWWSIDYMRQNNAKMSSMTDAACDLLAASNLAPTPAFTQAFGSCTNVPAPSPQPAPAPAPTPVPAPGPVTQGAMRVYAAPYASAPKWQ